MNFSQSRDHSVARTTGHGGSADATFIHRHANLWTAAFGLLLLLEIIKVGLFIGGGQRTMGPDVGTDVAAYWDSGTQIASGDLFLLRNPSMNRPPLYPAMLAVPLVFFGKHALPLAAALQHLMLLGITLITIFCVFRLTGSKLASLIALGLSACCVGRHCLAQTFWADNLLMLWITLYCLFLALWYQRPSMTKVIALGVILGLGILTKPSMNYLFVAPLFLFLVRANRGCRLIEFGKSASSLILVAALIVLPWAIRNYYCFGEPFVAKSHGRALWWGCHYDSGKQPPWSRANLPLAQGAHTREILEAIKGSRIDKKQPFLVHNTLVERGHSQIESEELMFAACLEAISEHPRQYATAVLRSVGLFYAKPPRKDLFWDYRKNPVGKSLSKYPHGPYAGQQPWWSEKLAGTLVFLMDHLWHPGYILYSVATGTVILSWIYLMIWGPQRSLYITYMGILLYFALMCALVAPKYRFRPPLEPLMIILVALALGMVLHSVEASGIKRRLFCRTSWGSST